LDARLWGRGVAVLRRRAGPVGMGVAGDQDRRAALPLHLAARDPPPPAVRPPHAVRLEGAAAAGHPEPRGDGRRRPPRIRELGTAMGLDDSLKGFAVTFRQMLRKPETIGYPERKTPVFP